LLRHVSATAVGYLKGARGSYRSVKLMWERLYTSLS